MSAADDYYGYAPLVTLDRPLALCGLPGSEPGATARVVSMFTGVPLVRVDDQVSHLAGRAYDLLVLQDGVDAALDLEEQVLDKALAKRTCPVIGLSVYSLQRPSARRRLLETCEVRYLCMPLSESVDRVAKASEADARQHAAVRQGGPADGQHLLPVLRFLDRLAREAPATVDIAGRTPMQVGRALADELTGGAG
jgi:shikimate kinase